MSKDRYRSKPAKAFPKSPIRTILVVGAGFMGTGIAEVCAQSNYRVFLTDASVDALDKSKQKIEWSLSKLAAKGLLKEQVEAVLERIVWNRNLQNASNVELIIEAAVEDRSTKLQLFSELDRLASPQTIFASSTSSIPISQLGAVITHPERMVGLHFFGPVPLSRLVEVIKGNHTSPKVMADAVIFVRSLGKTPVKVHQDVPAFVMNRIFFAAMREAVELVEKGVVSFEEVDIGMRLGYGWSLGPFEIADIMGLDTYLRIINSMKSLRQENLVPQSDLILNMVKRGYLGRKSQKGFYLYNSHGNRIKPR